MTPTTNCNNKRPTAIVNTKIRSLWLSAGGHLNPTQQEIYERLLLEWADAVHAEQADTDTP